MQQYPAHASPAFPPVASPRPAVHDRGVSEYNLDSPQRSSLPPLNSPALDVQRKSFLDGQRHDREAESANANSQSDGHADQAPPALLGALPEVHCEVRARIPTTTGQEMFLHLYHNNADNKEHLAIVFGPHIRSRSLDAVRPGESERDRMIRGAYTGTLFPGRTSSRVEQLRKDAGAPPRPSRSYLSQLNGPGAASSAPSSGSASEDDEPIPSYPAHLGPPLVRIHSECYTGETVWSARCDCGEQLDEAARLMSLPTPVPGIAPSAPDSTSPPATHSAGGVIVYLRQEGRGIGLLSKLKAYNLQDLGHDTMEANLLLRHPGDARSYGLATAILVDLGLGGERGIRLLTNNPEKVRAVEGPQKEVRVVERVPMIPLAWQTEGKEGVQGPEVEKYISTKIEKFKHMFSQ